jgi:hypothetical protein
MDAIREEFEKWAEGHYVKMPHYGFSVTHKPDGENYYFTAVQGAWIGWKAAKQQPSNCSEG